MRILIVHNFYLQPGGEDVVFKNEQELLRQNGHEVLVYTDDNRRTNSISRVSLALQTSWSWQTYSRLRKVLMKERPEIVHFHNIFPIISPAAFYACKENGISVVQTLHNYRYFCPAATLFRSGKVCEKCMRMTFPWPSIRHKCYHHSIMHSGVLAFSIFTHNLLNTWSEKVDAFIALTQFAKGKFVEAGFPVEKIFVKPNFIFEKFSTNEHYKKKERFFIYAGRLTEEKGFRTLCDAWMNIEVPIYVFGNGDFIYHQGNEKVRYMSHVDRDTILSYMKNAEALIFPSEWYEGFPVTIVEAFASSLPVISADIGSHAEIVRDKYAGLHFKAGDAQDLRAKVNWMIEHPKEQSMLGRNARLEYEQKYSPSMNYAILMDIYNRILGRHHASKYPSDQN